MVDYPTAKSATNMLWFTDPDVADPEDLPRIKGWRILVRPIPNAPKTKGGIILPDQTLEYADLLRSVGRVVNVGPLAYTRADMCDPLTGEPDPWCKEGDFILYPRYAGAKFAYAGVRFLIINDDEVMAVLKDPARINE